MTETHESANVQIRRAQMDDMPDVARLAAQLVRLHHAIDPQRFFLMEPVEQGYQRFLSEELQDKDALILVAVSQQKIVGYAYGRREPRNWNSLLDTCGALHDILVDESMRGAHVADLLLREVFRAFAQMGLPRVVLYTAHSNVRAQKVFARAGFRPTMIEMARELDERDR